MTRTDVSTPSFVVVCGLPGVGKSTVAAYLTDASASVRLRTDAVRKEHFETPTYSESETDAVYEMIFDQAREHLTDATTVVVDATFKRRRYRHSAKQVAVDLGVPFTLIKVEAEPAVVKQRIRSRDGISDASVEVYAKHREQFEPLELDHHIIDNSEALAQTYERVDAVVDAAGLQLTTTATDQ